MTSEEDKIKLSQRSKKKRPYNDTVDTFDHFS